MDSDQQKEDAQAEDAFKESERHRQMSEKGKAFAIEKLEKRLKSAFKDLQALSTEIDQLKSDDSDADTVRQKHYEWLRIYEDFLNFRNEHKTLINPDDDTFLMTDTILKSYKSATEDWILEKTKVISKAPSEKSIQPEDSASQTSVRKSASGSHSGAQSAVSSYRIREEQRQAELEMKKAALKKKQEIELAKQELELAKVRLKLEEEELNLNTEIQITKARTSVLDRYEQENKSNRSSSRCTPKGQKSHPHNKTPIKEQEHSKDILTYPPKLNPYSDNGQYTNIHSAEQAIVSVVRQLRKPIPDIKKFHGDPIEYRRFIRQFQTKVVSNCEDNDESMNYLDQFTGGEANRIVNGFSYLDASQGYPAALKELEERYGRAEVLANAFVKRALDWPNIKSDNPKSIDDYSIFLVECLNAIHSIEAVKVLQYPENMRRLVAKLPFFYHDKWRNVVERARDNNDTVEFHQLVTFVKKEARKANDATYGREAMRVDDATSKKTPKSTSARSKGTYAAKATEIQPDATDLPIGPISEPQMSSTAKNTTSGKPTSQKSPSMGTKGSAFATPCLYCASPKHTLETCDVIITLSFADRINFLKSKGLCFGCLKFGHLREACRGKATCQQCQGRHPTICHTNRTISQQNEPKVTNFSVGACAPARDHIVNTGAGDGETTMAIIPVSLRLKNGLKVVQTYAFLDSGSSVSFCTESVMNQLGATGKPMKIKLDTMGEPQTLQTYVVQGMEISNLNMTSTFSLPKLYTKDKMPVSKNHIPTSNDIKPWSHLNGINLPEINSDIGLLLGNNVADAYTPLEVRTGPEGSPHVTRSRLGWILWGLVRPPQSHESSSNTVNRAEIVAIEKQDNAKNLDILLKQYMNCDFPERSIDDKREASWEDKRFLQKIDESIQLSDGHYYIDLPFRSDEISFPSNEAQAHKRLQSLKTKLESNAQFKKDYDDFMNNILQKGYAEEVPSEELHRQDGKVWYIPHHGVYHPRKPGKLRVVFACTATQNGVSLNSCLLAGPDLTNNLLGVLLRFRLENIALMADIESMFYQVRVPKTDCDCLRFLWWPGGDTTQKPVTHRMVVHLFGAASSPSCSNAALKQTAIDNRHDFNETTTEIVNKNFYVDDCLASTDTTEKAIKLVQDLTELCQRGGFHLTKWLSNSHAVMASIAPEERSKEARHLDIDFDALPSERALGVHWDVEHDAFGYSVVPKNQPYTRRGILSVVSSMYDPLGHAAPYTLAAKILLQELCQKQLGWDDVIEGRNQEHWQRWLVDLPQLADLKLPRSYKPQDFGPVSTRELHVFSDASEDGYGVVIYMRLTSEDEKVHCSFVQAKSRVAPLKKITIPRLELTAATLAVRLCNMVTRELGCQFNKICFWTDSSSVLRYISNDTTRFHTFVANRVHLIREFSEPKQWRYIESKTNPADCASRGLTMTKLLQNTEWTHGPSFLWKPQSEWPLHELNRNLNHDDSEVKKTVLSTVVKSSTEIMERLLTYHSDWQKLKKTVAWLLLGMRNLRERIQQRKLVANQSQCLSKNPTTGLNREKALKTLHLDTDLLAQAEKVLITYEQRKHFANELSTLEGSSKMVKKNSSLYKLDPFIVDGVLRVGGRLARASIPFESKHPVILPKDSYQSQLIVKDNHKNVGHMGKSSVLNALRQKYWLIGASATIKALLSKCVVCRRYQARAFEQKMADLPEERITPYEPCFTNAACDFFGPFVVRRHRSELKRYGMIFTCLASRAVHLEVTNSMDTDSCINAVRRFISRRGPVKTIISDNGTNLVGCERELRKAIEGWNKSKIHQTLLQNNITWKFNPPSGSHFVGVWERLIRSVRKILYSLLHQQVLRLDDESLHTLFCEVEATLNSRPLTEVPSDVKDIQMEALTPNHLLTLRSGSPLPPGQFDKTDNYPRRRWRQVQYLSDLFWKRWISEYLPTLQERQKWMKPRRNVCVGDLVLIVENSPRNSWCLARVVEVILDRKGLARMAKVKTKNVVLLRPVDKLCLVLEADD